MSVKDTARPADRALVSDQAPAGLAPSGFDPSRLDEEFDGILRSKARALAASVWLEHRGHALRFESLSFESSEILVDCCLRGMCVGIIGGSSLARDSDGSPKGGDGEAGSVQSTTARAEGIAQGEGA